MVRGALTLALVSALLLATVAALAQDTERDRLERLNIRETALSADQGRNLNQFSHLLTVLIRFRRDPPPALLVNPRDAVDAARAAILVKAIAPELRRRARVYAAQAGEIARQRRLAAVASEALFTQESQKADLHSATPNAAAQLRPALDAEPVHPPAALLPPLPGPVIHRFGDALSGGGRANGLTILTAPKAGVRAPDAGIVQYVGPVKGWGVILILRLAGGYHLVLAGLERTDVAVGQSVAAGAAVGEMPDGRQASPELYLEVREHGAPVNPGRWLKTTTG